nr:Sir2 family NAD-dependent protein deacetylase [Pedobacter agri]
MSKLLQNIDDLHERAGSKKVTHLHGVITKSQSDLNPNLTYTVNGAEIKMGELCELGSQLRPHVVWFGEAVPMIEVAARICTQAEVCVLIGTSLAVYPAAGLVDFVPSEATKYIIDPKTPNVKRYKNIVKIEENAVQGMKELRNMLLNGK